MDNKFLAKWYINYLDSKHSGSTIDRISMTFSIFSGGWSFICMNIIFFSFLYYCSMV